ncbi:uncharacterized protein BCR38DRAFT_489448 [Pseudomassariella vexata]|uniref:EKC/KEOPS complex subunit GON7 n=1 Tax=Pseudomassariella vexata TaxID=1141098 RepID=A0A1Y2DHF1_9PEZI|nr:uncharacterized protein BCR38DRAFT_489448 [Pseudomassariella vexata]ORY58534.1 hypothetical protein BCR38DRAFT_489448 [Pseudomassariella vexata]
MSQPTLTVTYSSPTNAPFSHTTPLSAIATADKTTHLNSLRAAITDLQTRINTELTQRMDEDKIAAEQLKEGQVEEAQHKVKRAKSEKVDEDAEEENYGEEVVEED